MEVIVDEDNQSTVVVVPDYQLSLAIGKRGQNARLVAKLTGWKIDIKSETDARDAGIYPVIESEELEDIVLSESDDEDIEIDDVNLEESNLTTAELAADIDETSENNEEADSEEKTYKQIIGVSN